MSLKGGGGSRYEMINLKKKKKNSYVKELSDSSNFENWAKYIL